MFDFLVFAFAGLARLQFCWFCLISLGRQLFGEAFDICSLSVCLSVLVKVLFL